jgi:hypothetical protein
VPRLAYCGEHHQTVHHGTQGISATIYVKKKDGMSDDDFIDYYNTKQFVLLHVGLISCAAVPGG